MDMSKANDCLPHDLLIAKLRACDLGRSSLPLLMDYLNSRKQQAKVGSSCSKKLNTESSKVLYWDLYYSTYLQKTYSLP